MKTLFLTALSSALILSACSGAAETVSADMKAGSQSPNAAMLAELPTLSGDDVWTVDYAQSTLQFRALHAGERFTGDFSRFAAAINLDPNAPETGRVAVVVDINSLDAKDDDRNANLPDTNWFNVAAFPYATFQSSDISAQGGGKYRADGTLSIKGISNPMALNFTLNVEGDTATATGLGNLNRPDFKLGTESSDFANEDWVGFPVEVMFEVTATR